MIVKVIQPIYQHRKNDDYYKTKKDENNIRDDEFNKILHQKLQK